MFPLSDDDRNVHITPIVNFVLIALNVLVFVYELSLGSDSQRLQSFIFNFGVVPEQVAAGNNLISLLTSMFIHGGWAHLFGNMLFLWVFGNNIEDALGHIGYIVFYLGTGLAASAAHIFLSLNTSGADIPSVGASGAISGVLGAYIVLYGMNKVRVLIAYFVTVVPAWMMIGLWAAQQFIATYGSIANTEQTDGVAYAAHAGGFAAGVVIALVLRSSIRSRATALPTR